MHTLEFKTERETKGLQRLVPRTNILVIGRWEHKPTDTCSGSSSKRETNRLHSQHIIKQKQNFTDNIKFKFVFVKGPKWFSSQGEQSVGGNLFCADAAKKGFKKSYYPSSFPSFHPLPPFPSPSLSAPFPPFPSSPSLLRLSLPSFLSLSPHAHGGTRKCNIVFALIITKSGS